MSKIDSENAVLVEASNRSTLFAKDVLPEQIRGSVRRLKSPVVHEGASNSAANELEGVENDAFWETPYQINQQASGNASTAVKFQPGTEGGIEATSSVATTMQPDTPDRGNMSVRMEQHNEAQVLDGADDIHDVSRQSADSQLLQPEPSKQREGYVKCGFPEHHI